MNLTLQKKGKEGENQAESYLKKLGHKIVSRNYRCRYGEIDIISEKNSTIYFTEVKTRTDEHLGYPYEAVNLTKIQHMKKAACSFLLKNKLNKYKLKLSVISILLNKNEVKFWEDIES